MPSTSRSHDLTGRSFGRLLVLSRDDSHVGKGGSYWFCRCECGSERRVHGGNLRKGLTRSCGCLRKETHTKHGYSNKPGKARTYRIWNVMKQRCHNPNSTAYPGYGGAGITVCDRWRDSFASFLEDMGPAPDDMSLDRINPRGNYEPGNCRWATSKEQAANKRTSNQTLIDRMSVDDLFDLLSKKIGLPRELIMPPAYYGP